MVQDVKSIMNDTLVVISGLVHHSATRYTNISFIYALSRPELMLTSRYLTPETRADRLFILYPSQSSPIIVAQTT